MSTSFGSDNHSGVNPLILKAIEKANNGYAVAYGDDPYTMKILHNIEKLLGGNCKAAFVLNGTGANVVALSTFLNGGCCILAPKSAHILEDECGAVEKFSGCKIIPLECTAGKVSPEAVKEQFELLVGDQHKSQPAILSISQPTEFETLYTIEEIKALADLVHKNGCYLHIDGSRISNAAAAMGKSIKEIVADTGADVLSFGGTKNGMLMGEAVVVLNAKRNKVFAERLKFIRKQATQLYSKNRFIAAQFDAYLKDDLYLKMAGHSNSMAKLLEKELKKIKGVKQTKKVETNAVYISLINLSEEKINELQRKYNFHIWTPSIKEVRLMCSWNTTEADIQEIVSDFRECFQKQAF